MSAGKPAKIGRVALPIEPRLLEDKGPDEILAAMVPTMVNEARRYGGEPCRPVRLLSEGEYARLGADAAAAVRAQPGRVWIVATMVPIGDAIARKAGADYDQAQAVLGPTVRRGPDGRTRIERKIYGRETDDAKRARQAQRNREL